MKVTYSDYLLSRQFNRKVYDKVKRAIEALDYKAEAEFNMSAKYQSPVLHVEGPQNAEAADEIYNILQEYFNAGEPDYKDDNRTDISIQD